MVPTIAASPAARIVDSNPSTPAAGRLSRLPGRRMDHGQELARVISAEARTRTPC